MRSFSFYFHLTFPWHENVQLKDDFYATISVARGEKVAPVKPSQVHHKSPISEAMLISN